jgi:hypothetical protein
MKTILHRFYAYAFFVVLSSNLFAQTEFSSFNLTGMGVSTPFASDYQCLGINPANLDLPTSVEQTNTVVGLGEFGFSFFSEALSKDELRQNLFREKIAELTFKQRMDYALLFSSSNTAVDLAATALGMSTQTEKAGSFAFSIQDKVTSKYQLGKDAAELLWLGRTSPYFDLLQLSNGQTISNSQNLSQSTIDSVVQGIASPGRVKSLTQLLQGSSLSLMWTRQFNFGYGKRIVQSENFDLYVGVGFKYILGQSYMELAAANGTATAFGAISPIFKIDYSKFDTTGSNIVPVTNKFAPVGRGYGVDFGLTAVIRKHWTVSGAITDIGQITWDGNLFKLKDINLENSFSSGLLNLQIENLVQYLNGSDGLLQWQGEKKRTTNLPRTVRFGASYKPGNLYRVGIDIVQPLSSDFASLNKPVIAIGGEISPLKWIHIQLGYVQGGNYNYKIPCGLIFSPGQGKWEFGAASRDMVTFFRSKQPVVSLAAGFMRFHF